jgi:hypothetical protein
MHRCLDRSYIYNHVLLSGIHLKCERLFLFGFLKDLTPVQRTFKAWVDLFLYS